VSSPSPSEPARLRIDWRAPLRATWLVILALVAVHVATGLWWYGEGRGELLANLVFDRAPGFRVAVGGQHQRWIDAGQTWRWLTSVWLHTGLAHLFVNVSGLWLLGRVIEPWIGSVRWFALFVVGGVAGSVASSLVGVTQSDGASGGGFALIGAIWVLGWRLSERLEADERQLLGPIWSAMLIGNLVLGLVLPFVDAAAHAGGLVLGILAGALLKVADQPAVEASS
jgi:rhomboid protease GluP